MEVRELRENMYAIRLEVGEEIIASLKKFVIDKNIGFAKLSAIGAVEKTSLGYLEGSTYVDTVFPSEMELVSLNGSVSWVEENPFIHAHAVLSDKKANCYGGHVHTSTVSATCEIFLEVFDTKVNRELDQKAKIKVWNLK